MESDEPTEPGGGERASGTEEVEAALRRLMSAERELDTSADALAARRTEPPHSVSEQAVRTLESVHRLVMEIEDAAHQRASLLEREAQSRSEALIAEAEVERERVWSELRVLIADAVAEVERLHDLRDRLREDLSQVLSSSRATLERLAEDAREARVAPAPRPPLAVPEPPPQVSVPEPMPPRLSVPGPTPQPPEPPGQGLAAVAETAPPPPSLVRIELDAGPFPSFADVLAFESQLAGRDEVASVYVSRFTERRVRASVGGADREELLRAIRELPSVSVVEDTGAALTLTVAPG